MPISRNVDEKTPLDELSEIALRFLVDRTDWSEPYAGIGFATKFQEEVQKALSRKTSINIFKE